MPSRFESDAELGIEAELRSVAGHSYYTPASELAAVGRCIVTDAEQLILWRQQLHKSERFYCLTLHTLIQDRLDPSEVAFALYYLGDRWLAPLISHPADLAAYEIDKASLGWRPSGVYAVPRKLADQILVQEP